MTSSVPPYLVEPLQLMGELRSTVVEDVEQYVQLLRTDSRRLQILVTAYEEIVEYGDQVWLQEASVDYRRVLVDGDTKRAVIHLLVIFCVLAECDISPFNGYGWRGPIKLIRADYIPAGAQPLIDFAIEVTHGSGDLAILEDLDRLSPLHLARLRALGEHISNDPAFSSALTQWLQHKPDAVEVELVQRTLGMLEFLDFEW